MKNKLFLGFLILLGISFRLLPHEPNFVPLGAIAIFAGFLMSRKLAWAIPLLIMLVTDAAIGFHATMLWVYGSYALIGLLAGVFKSKLFRTPNFVGSGLASASIFYLLTNFGVFVSTNLYTKDMTGLIQCYVNALPFFRNTLFGDVFYVVLLFGAYQIWQGVWSKNNVKSLEYTYKG